MPGSKVREKMLAFPWPIEWSVYHGNLEFYLIGVAWGPANSPEMLSRGQKEFPREKFGFFFNREKPKFNPNRPYALALHLRARRSPNGGSSLSVNLEQYAPSRLRQIRNVQGDTEPASLLTPFGFVPEAFGAHFRSGQAAAEYWVFFPAAPTQREFLFQVDSARRPPSSFKIDLTASGFVLRNVTPGSRMACLDVTKRFAGTVGADIPVVVHLSRNGVALSGTEVYTRFGGTLELRGTVDSLGNFRIEEQSARDRVSGIFDGRFTKNCHTMTGYFSKPDKSRLLPFEFRSVP